MSTINVTSVPELQAGDRAEFTSEPDADNATRIKGIVDSVSLDGWTIEDRHRPGRPERFPLVVLHGGHSIAIGPREGMFSLVSATREEPEWKPGTLAEAAIQVEGVQILERVRVERTKDPHTPWFYFDGWGGAHWLTQEEVTDIRPLVVIDLTPVLRADIEEAGRRLVAAHAMQPRNENVDVFVAQVYGALGIEAP